jgi:hypothetical protein
MRVGDAFQVLVVSLAQLLVGLLLFVQGYALPEDAFLGQPLGVALEVEDEHFEHDGHSQLSQLVVLYLVDLLRNQGVNCILELQFL